MPAPSSTTVSVACAVSVSKLTRLAPESSELATISVRIVSSREPGYASRKSSSRCSRSTRVSPIMPFLPPELEIVDGRASLPQVSAVLLVLGADVFKEVAVRYQPQSSLDGEGPRVVLRIIESDLQIHMAEIAAAIALGDAHGFAARVAESVEPGPVVEADRVDY